MFPLYPNLIIFFLLTIPDSLQEMNLIKFNYKFDIIILQLLAFYIQLNVFVFIV